MTSGLSEDTVCRTCTCQVVGGPQADGTATPFRRVNLFMSLDVIYREQARACGQSPGVPGQEDGWQEAHPYTLSTKHRFSSGSPYRAESSGSLP